MAVVVMDTRVMTRVVGTAVRAMGRVPEVTGGNPGSRVVLTSPATADNNSMGHSNTEVSLTTPVVPETIHSNNRVMAHRDRPSGVVATNSSNVENMYVNV